MKEQMKLLIGYDGSQCANAALDDLRRAGLPREAQAIILSVFERWLPNAGHNNLTELTSGASRSNGVTPLQTAVTTSAEKITETRALALDAKLKLQAHFPDWNIKAEESLGSPAREILKRAAGWAPDLIAVGSQGCSGLGRFLLGSVSQKVANEAQCSVRVARGTAWKNGAPVRILLALDGSPGSDAAVEAVRLRMWPPETEVRITTVIDRSNGPILTQLVSSAGGGVTSTAHHAWVQEFINSAAKKLRGPALLVSSKIEEGDPKSLIIANAEEWGAECIFVGASYAHSSFERLLLGSVATAVVSRAHCSVEIVRGRPEPRL
ncbi:MAG TPA: universal stress protein [Pyrinomonadaceae bacterium]|nr:universal stress protein [Pyrinomonadaceae bacterium]